MKRVLCLLALHACAVSAQSGPLGRLFHTDEERARLELQRGQTAKQASQPRSIGTLRHDGIVLRSSGPATWFVNGNAHDTQALPSLSARPAGTALQLPGSDGRAVKLRPGEQTAVDESGQAAPATGVIDIRTGPAR